MDGRKKKDAHSLTMYGTRGLGVQHKKHSSPPENGIVILLYGDFTASEDDTVIEFKNLDFGKKFLAGELIAIATKKKGIGTVAYPLFYLFDLLSQRWLLPSETVACSDSSGRLLVLRIRCMPSPDAIVKHLFPNDREYAFYHFLQCRHDFVNDNLQYSKKKNVGREHILGFVVMDLVRYGKCMKYDLKQIESLDLKHFIPLNAKDLVKGILDKQRLKNNIRPYLKTQNEKYEDYSELKLMLNFILGLQGYIEGYGRECFDVNKGQKVYVDPYNETRSGLYSYMVSDKDFVPFARIEELVSLTVSPRDRDGQKVYSVLVNRMTGAAVDHLFSSMDDALSFVSVVTTYHRMMEDYHHMLCNDVPAVRSHILESLKVIGSHGPVSKKWATERLQEKNRVDVANNYLLKQTSTDLDTLVLAYINDRQDVDFFLLERRKEGYHLNIDDDDPTFASPAELLQYYRSGKQPRVALKKCVRPTAPLDKKIYLCKEDKTLDDLAAAEAKQTKTTVSLVSEIQVTKKLGYGHYTEVYLGKMGKDHVPAAVKRLRQEDEGKHTEHFIKAAHKISFWSHSTIVSVLGICLAPHFSLIMECGEKGSLEFYLRDLQEKERYINNYLLIMAAEQLAQAVLYLESQSKARHPGAIDSCHGNIRTRNILVFGHEDKLLRIKLGDPGMVYACNKLGLRAPPNAERLPWLAPELYDNLERMTKYSDRYAYGITLWEILSEGERPFKYMNSAEEIEAYVRDGFTLHKPASCPERIYHLMKRCWHKNPEERISAKEVVGDIINLIQNDYHTSTYETPTWDKKTISKDSIVKSSSRSDTLENNMPQNAMFNAGQTGAFESTSAPQIPSTSRTNLDNVVNESMAFHTSQGATGTWHTQTKGPVSPVADSSLSWDSTTPLMGPRSPTEDGSSLATSTSRDTLTTVLGGSADQLNSASMATTSPVGVKAKFSLKADLPKTPDMPEPIEPLNHQDLELTWSNKLGQGHYGEVYKGYYKTKRGHPRPVAIKRLKPEMYERFSVEFEREFQIMIRLEHRNIVEIIGRCVQRDQDNPMLLVMEYVKLGALKSFLKNNKNSLEICTMLRFAMEIAEGMVYLWKQNIYHRDLAARNVLVTEDRSMKITDFGLAKAMDKDQNYYRMSAEKDFPFQWYAPEALLHKYNAKSDVWSYGITVWEIFSYGADPNYPISNSNINVIQALLDYLHKGKRLALPKVCSREVYESIMLPCWEYTSEKRKSIVDISLQARSLHKKCNDAKVAAKS